MVAKARGRCISYGSDLGPTWIVAYSVVWFGFKFLAIITWIRSGPSLLHILHWEWETTTDGLSRFQIYSAMSLWAIFIAGSYAFWLTRMILFQIFSNNLLRNPIRLSLFQSPPEIPSLISDSIASSGKNGQRNFRSFASWVWRKH